MCLAHNIIEKGINVPCPVDANGRFTDEVPDFVGRHVKEVRLRPIGHLVGWEWGCGRDRTGGLSHRRETYDMQEDHCPHLA